MNKKIWLWIIAVAIVILIVWNYPLTYHVGVDGIIFEKNIPLYAKTCGFLYRDWIYKDIVRGIIAGEKDDVKKALAILRWTGDNIIVGAPKGVKSIDDHPLNIIIRQYGFADQRDDVFTILCTYAGMKGGVGKCYDASRKNAIRLSFINIGGRWLVFDAGRQKYFLNKKGEVASVDDFARGDVALSVEDSVYYKVYLDNLKDVDLSHFTRADEQMPTRRFSAEIKKIMSGKYGAENNSE